VTDAVFTALADPTRRRVIESLASRDSATATALAAELPITRQAVAKHLGALRAAELVSVERLGREVHYRLDPRPLSDAASWIERVGAEWDSRLDDLKRLVESR
jgi:DNA-binding transcriptional ArsR family regulator